MSSIKYRHLGRDSAHRRALLRNLVTSLIENESISTTLAKAKETQRMAEKLITLGKKNTEASRTQAMSILFEPHKHLPKLLGPLRDRYLNRPGGYTRLLLSEPLKDDAAPSAILSLVDGPKDMRFSITAKTLLREREAGLTSMPEMTAVNVRKVTRFRNMGEDDLEAEVERLKSEARRAQEKSEREFEDEGTTFEWARSSGPGKMTKKPMKLDYFDKWRFQKARESPKGKGRD